MTSTVVVSEENVSPERRLSGPGVCEDPSSTIVDNVSDRSELKNTTQCANENTSYRYEVTLVADVQMAGRWTQGAPVGGFVYSALRIRPNAKIRIVGDTSLGSELRRVR